MNLWTVLFTATASEHVETIGQWWAANRKAAPALQFGTHLAERVRN